MLTPALEFCGATSNLWHLHYQMKIDVAHRVGPAAALLLCAVAAWVVTLVKWEAPQQEIIPFVFLVFVLLLGALFGRTVGILGSVIAALVFAYSMYAPLGSFRVANQGARSGIGWMLLAGVTLSYLLLPSGSDRSKHSP